MIKMIKCPHCHSSAQVKMDTRPILSDNKAIITLPCECGCGCQFELDYMVDDYFVSTINTIERKDEVK